MSDILVLEMGLSPGFHVLNAIPPVDLSMSDTWSRDDQDLWPAGNVVVI